MPAYAVLIYSDSTPAPDAEQDRRRHDEHAEALAATSLLAAWAFTPPSSAVSVRSSGITDGPFLEAAFSVAGVYVVEAADLDEAVRIAAGNPAVAAGGGVEVRPVGSGGVVRAPHG